MPASQKQKPAPGARARRGASASSALLVAGVMTILVGALWLVPSRPNAASVTIRTSDGTAVPSDVVSHAKNWLASDVACLRALEVVGTAYAVPDSSGLQLIRDRISLDPNSCDKPVNVARLRYYGSSEVGAALVRELSTQYVGAGIEQLARKYRSQQAELRHGLNAARIDLHRLALEADQLGAQIDILQQRIQSTRIANGRRNCRTMQCASSATTRPWRDARQLSQLLENRSHLLQKMTVIQKSAVQYDRELALLGERLDELSQVHLVAHVERLSDFTLLLGSMTTIAVLVGLTFANGKTAGLARRSSPKMTQTSDASIELGMPFVAFAATNSTRN